MGTKLENDDISPEDDAFIAKLQNECDILTEDMNEFFSNTYGINAIISVCSATIRNIFETPELKAELHPYTIYLVMDRLAECMGKEAARQAINLGKEDHPIVDAIRKRYGQTK